VLNPVKPLVDHPAAPDLSGWGPGGRWFESSLPDLLAVPVTRALGTAQPLAFLLLSRSFRAK